MRFLKQPSENRVRHAGIVTIALAAYLLASGCATDNEASREAQRQTISDHFQAELDRLWLAAQTSEEDFPGATAAYILADDHVSAFATGYSDVEEEQAMHPDMRMPSGSIGKTYVAAVVLSLVQDGELDLDAPISDWLGREEWFDRLPNGADITVRMLLNHSSGLLDHVFDSEDFQRRARELLASGDANGTFAPLDLVSFVLDAEPLFPAGQGFHYTDTGYILLGLVIEEATHSTYWHQLRERILNPLSLTFTTPQNRRSVPDLAQGYAPTSAELFGIGNKVVEDGELTFDPEIEWTGGGLFNNPQDMVRWAKILYSGKAMKQPYLEELLSSVAGVEDGSKERIYGLGVDIRETDLGVTYGHGGFFPGYNSQLAYFPDQGIAIALQINTDNSRAAEHLGALAKVLLEEVQRSGIEYTRSLTSEDPI